ncbi:hypothetical protein AB5I39_04385 [Sphingomonas sp. MMS24-J45]|uniref:hypothetical protein n=1 Tax=Sphingomonas sp. MMS24-J45 TaxID=3238806 RepID=UPI00384D0FE4
MRFSSASLTAFAAILLVSGCVGAPTAPQPAPGPIAMPRPAPTPVLPVPQGSDWRDWTVTPGDWSYRGDARGSIATYGQGGGAALLTLRCDRGAGAVTLSRSGAVGAPLTLRTSSLVRSVPVQPGGGSATAALNARDPLLDAMAFSRGRFIVEQQGAPTLVVPAWAEVGRVIEDCRG